MLNARTAKAKDFDEAAQRHANAFWVWAIVSGVTFYFAGGFAIIPGVIAGYCVFQSVGASSAANSLRKGTYRISNPNNGAPDGDARNYMRADGLGDKESL